jgi:hypothetical protein
MSTSTRSVIRTLAACAALFIVGLNTARANEPPVVLLNEWWQWAVSIPSAVNPIFDNSGKACALGQRGNLWFLAGNTGGKTSRQCSLPAGSRVLIPVHNTFCFADGTRTAAQCYDDVAQHYASFTSWSAELDGVAQEIIDQPPVPGEYVFNVAVPRNGVFDFRPGLYRATAAAGRWAIVGFTTPGVYSLRVRSQSPAFASDVTYQLTVAEVN